MIAFEFNVTVGERDLLFKVTEHFVARALERQLLKTAGADELKAIIQRAVVIDSRPNRVLSILDHGFKDSVCLYDNVTKSIAVIEENNTLVTIYSAEDSRWSQRWLSKTPKGQRELFKLWVKKPFKLPAITFSDTPK